MNNLILITLILTAATVSYIAYQIRQWKNDLEDIKILLKSHHQYSGLCHQYTLVSARTIMLSCMQQCVEDEDYQAAAEWKSAIEKVEKLIKTPINF